MNSKANIQSQTSRSSRRESLSTNEEPTQSPSFDRQQYIADCKRLLSGFRKCQQQDAVEQKPNYEIKKDEHLAKFKPHDSSHTTKQEKNGSVDNVLSIELLEQMLDEFDVLYNSEKSQLSQKLISGSNFDERKITLDDFFGKIEEKSQQIQNSSVYRAFKNLYISGQNLNDQKQAQEQMYQQNLDKIKQRKQELRMKKEREEDKENGMTGKQLQFHPTSLSSQQSTLLRDIQNSTDLSPEKRQRENQQQQQNENIKGSKMMNGGHRASKTNQENTSPVKTVSNQENYENKQNFSASRKSGKENSSQRRRKSERLRENKQPSQPLPSQQLPSQQQPSQSQQKDETQSLLSYQEVQIQEQLQQQESMIRDKLSSSFKDKENKSLFKHSKLYSKSQIEPEPVDITKVISLDSQVINYGKFISGKILGSTLQISNTSTQEHIIEIFIDNKSKEFSCDEVFGPYQREELPFEYQDGTIIKNSELDYQSWYIENPISKDLVKSLIIRVPANGEKELIIVMKAPQAKLQFNMVSFISLKMAQSLRRSQSQANSEEPNMTEIEKRLKKKGSEITDIDIETVIKEKEKEKEKELRVMVIGKLENPKIECLRELYHDETCSKVIPIGVKKSIAQQKFRIPFKNSSLTQDADIEFTFIKMPKAEGEENSIDLTQYFEFYCQPSNMKIGMNQQGFLNVLIKVNTARLTSEVSDKELLRNKQVNKLLIGRLKDTSVIFSYFVTVNIINQ